MNEQDCKPSEAKAHIIGELNKAISSCLSIEIDNLGSIEDGKGILYFRKADVNNPFAYDVLSSGEKEVVDILLDLYLRKDSYINSVYIIDEPELHLNAAIQRKLLVEIDKMIPENCQIWVATHSIGFIRALQEELNAKSQVIRFQADNKWASEAYILKPIVKNRAAWQDLFQTALDDMAKLVAPRTIIYCEGRDFSVGGIERGLDAIVFNNIFGTKYPDVLFISSGGNTELDKRSTVAIAVLSKALPDTEILVLKDRDMASGKETDEDMRQQYLLNNPANHRVFKRREIENYLYDKDVLKKYCSSNGYTFGESAYDAFVTDIVNQSVKDETTRIKNICGIQVSINPETFKKNISNFFDEDMVVYKELEQEVFKRQ